MILPDDARIETRRRPAAARGAWLIALLLIAPVPIASGPAAAQSPTPTAQPGASQATQPMRSAPESPKADLAAPAVPTRAVPTPDDAKSVTAAPPRPTVANALLPHDLSPWGMFLNADVIVKAVMVGLAFASLVTWTIWLAKSLELVAAKRNARQGLAALATAANLSAAAATLSRRTAPVAQFIAAALDEAERSASLPPEGVKERAGALLGRIEARAGRLMTRGTGALATIGATAPFVGLFGTVWGIMNSFIGISKTNTTNLAVVAPGIAEALLATAMGLIAAIPAVMIYNVFARSIAVYRAQLADASTEVMRHLSRDLDRGIRQPSERDRGITPLRRSAE